MILSELTTQIANLKKQNENKEKQIDNLFLALEEISQKKQSIIYPAQISYNFLHKHSVEVINKIMIFLDLPKLLQFRLVCNSANKLVLTILSKKIQILQNQSLLLEAEFKDFQKEQEQLSPEEIQQLAQAKNGLNSIHKSDIVELKSMASPSQIVIKVLGFVQVLVDPNFKPSQNPWKQAQLMLNDYKFIEKLIQLDMDAISDKQINLLQEVHLFEVNQVFGVSRAAGSFFIFIQNMLMILESKVYINKRQKKQRQEKLAKIQKLINNLKKICKEQ